jgi:hypothetical protein
MDLTAAQVAAGSTLNLSGRFCITKLIAGDTFKLAITISFFISSDVNLLAKV